MTGDPGDTLTYTVTITNSGNVPDVFTLSASSTWNASLSVSDIALDLGEKTTFMVIIDIPTTAADETDIATITATSSNDPGLSDSIDLTSISESLKIYLPLVTK